MYFGNTFYYSFREVGRTVHCGLLGLACSKGDFKPKGIPVYLCLLYISYLLMNQFYVLVIATVPNSS